MKCVEKYSYFFRSDLFVLHPAKSSNIVAKVYHYITCEPWVGFIMVMCFVHIIWVHILLFLQLFQVGVAMDADILVVFGCWMIIHSSCVCVCR